MSRVEQDWSAIVMLGAETPLTEAIDGVQPEYAPNEE
jgi:hypothetical protein